MLVGLVPGKSPSTMVLLLFIVLSVGFTVIVNGSEPPKTVDCLSEEPDVWEFQPHPTDCNLYIVCMNDIGLVFECPEGLYFDSETKLCDLPENTDCESVTDSPTETEEPPTEVPPTEEPPVEPGCNERCVLQSATVGGEVSDLNDCSRFINCLDNCKGTRFTCPGNLYFNQILSVCDLPERSECLLEVCVNQPLGLRYSLNSCIHFYLCQANTARLLPCGLREVFHPTFGCLPGDPSRCEQPLQSQSIPDAPDNVKDLCGTKDSKFIIHPEHCDVFYRCIKGQLFGRRCQEGLLFDETVGMCNIAEKVDCII